MYFLLLLVESAYEQPRKLSLSAPARIDFLSFLNKPNPSPISIDTHNIYMDIFFWTSVTQKGTIVFVMDKNSRDPVHCWLVLRKAFQAAAKYLYAGLEETGIDDTDFRILEALLNKGPLPVNTIGPKVYLTPGSISVAIDRLLDRGLVSRVESPEDRRVRIVSLTPKGKELITPIFRKHAAEIRKVFADASPKELRALETTSNKDWEARREPGDRSQSKVFKPTMT
jgi:MarR family 2-MHQ and catechol resistance regulon transcriptional repressor